MAELKEFSTERCGTMVFPSYDMISGVRRIEISMTTARAERLHDASAPFV